MEAVIDFGDDDREGDVSAAVCDPLIPRLQIMLSQLQSHLDDGRRGELIREGLRIVIAGPPNAGNIAYLFFSMACVNLFML
jgi:tRNA modification GTPase